MFDAHGRFHIRPLGDVLLIDGWGPWDQQTAVAYSKAVAAAAETMQAPWACLIRFRTEPLMWGDTRDHIRAAVRARVERGMRVIAVVMDDVPGAWIVRQQYGSLYEECGATFAFFHDGKEALAWLRSEGHAQGDDAEYESPA